MKLAGEKRASLEGGDWRRVIFIFPFSAPFFELSLINESSGASGLWRGQTTNRRLALGMVRKCRYFFYKKAVFFIDLSGILF